MEAKLDVDGLAYCVIKIEGANMPATKNFLYDLKIQDGFGISVPILQLTLNDTNGTLSGSLNLVDGTLITLTLGKTREDTVRRDFRVFSYRKETTSDGPMLVVTCILNVPKWVSGVFTKAIDGTSASAISTAASEAGLSYEGPKGSPDDNQTWLNVNQTWSSFTEDVAIRGYISDQSAMYRILTMDAKVKYKDLFSVVQGNPEVTYLMNVSAESAEGKPLPVRETQDASLSGFSTHLTNYGRKQYNHSLNDGGQTSIESLQALSLGDGLPINNDVKSSISERGTQIVYTGFDPGTAPKDASNIHNKYEQALYQNTRYYALFSERLIVLMDQFTEVETFACTSYKHADQDGTQFVNARSLEGNWLLGGKTLWINAGHKYAEIHHLYRPYVQEAGNTNASAAPTVSRSPVLSEAASNIPTPASLNSPKESNLSTGSSPASVITPVGIKAASSAMTSLKAVDAALPSVPIKPLSDTVTRNDLAAQSDLKNAVSSLTSSDSELSSLLSTLVTGTQPITATLKKFSASDVQTLARKAESNTSAVMTAVALGIERVSTNGNAISTPVRNLVSTAYDSIVGDVKSGGVWESDLVSNGVDLASTSIENLTKALEDTSFDGTSFLFDSKSLDYAVDNVLIAPKESASNLRKWAELNTAENLLADKGIDAFRATFGDMTLDQANDSIKELSKLAAAVEQLYDPDEVILDYVAATKDVTLAWNDANISPVVDRVLTSIDKGNYVEVVTQKAPVSWDYYFKSGKVSADVEWTFPYTFPGRVTAGVFSSPNPNTTKIADTITNWMR